MEVLIMMARTFTGWMVAGLVLALGAAVPASAETVMHGRVSYESGGGMVKGAADSDWGYATVNTLVLTGDTLWADQGALLEVEFNGGSFLRMADQSKADVSSLPPNAVFRAWTGSYYVQRVSRSSGNLLFQTPACQVSVDRDSHVRIDVVDTGATTVTVRWGRATVGTDKGQAVVASTAQRVFVDPGYLPSVPQGYNTSQEDDFDAWSRERARLVATGDQALPTTYRVTSAPMGTADLVNYGEWVYVDNTPYWRPTVTVDYVPYRHGIWSYTPGCGYVWVGDYPFGYVTSHYGRWCYRPSYGWLWSYSDAWSPAWVAAVRCGPYFAWTPLDPWNRPCVVGNSIYSYGGFTLSVGAGSYCLADNLFYGYSYARPVTAPIFTNISGNNIYVWNIYGNHVNINYPWTGNLPIRDYKPQRVIRGPESIAAGSRVVRASERATRLESSLGRGSFRAIDRTGDRGIRTNIADSTHQARIRDVGVQPARATEGARTSERVATAANSSSVRGMRDAQARNVDPAAETAMREGREVSRGERSSSGTDTVTRGERGERRIGTDANGAPARTARENTDLGNPGEGSRFDRTTTTRDAGTRSERTITPSEGRGNRNIDTGAAPTRTTRTQTDLQSRGGPRVITLDNGAGRSSRSMADRTPSVGSESRTESPRMQRVDPGSGGRSYSTEPRRVERSMPESYQRTEPRSFQRSEPSYQRSEPRVIERSEPRVMERSAPRVIEQRSEPRNIQRYEPAPRVMERPSPAPRMEAPSMPQRSMDSPRAMERPSISAAPQIQAPQRSDFGSSGDRGMGSSRGSSSERSGGRGR
jgi:hypothetical protein